LLNCDFWSLTALSEQRLKLCTKRFLKNCRIHSRHRGRGRPLSVGSTKVLLPLTDNPEEAKYCDMRTRNNLDGQKCRQNKKRKIETEKIDLEAETTRKEELEKKVRLLTALSAKIQDRFKTVSLTDEAKILIQQRLYNINLLSDV
jgi:hypothetical protein